MKQQDIEFEVGIHSSTGSRPWGDGRPKLNLDRYIIRSYDHTNEENDGIMLAMIADTLSMGGSYVDWDTKYPPSQTVIDIVSKAFELGSTDSIPERIKSYLEQSSDVLRKMTYAWVTIAVVVIRRKKLYVASAGDCRVFLFRNGDVKQITVVHTLAEHLIEHEYVTVEELMHSIYDAKGPLRALGYDEASSSAPDLRLRLRSDDDDESARANQGLSLLDGDQIVLTSGRVFFDYIEPDEWMNFKQLFMNPKLSAQEAVDRFITPLRERNDVVDLTMIALRIRIQQNPPA